MTDISALEAYGGELSEAAAMATAAAEKQRQIVNGDALTDVLTESGPVPTLAKQAVLAQAKVTASLQEVASQMAGAMTYATTALGLAGTHNGGYFSVPSPVDMETSILFQNAAGVAVEVKRYPSATVLNVARRGNYLLSGRATKVEKIGATLDYRVSWGRLYIFTGTGKAQANVQAVNDLVVPNGKCAYVDLAEPLVGGEYVVHVSDLPLSTVANPPGSYIDDSKIILFTCSNAIIGGELYPQYQAVADAAVARPALAASLLNVLDRQAWHVVGKATKLQPLVATPSTYSISFNELTVTGGATFTAKRVAPVASLNIGAGEALYVDLDSAPNGSGQLVPQVTAGGYTAGMLASGTFVTDRKVYLFINGTGGIGGPLAQQAIGVDLIDAALDYRTKRATYQVIGDLTRFLLSGTVCVMSFADLRISRGVGATSLVVAALTDVSVPQGQALYVDLGSALVGGKLVAQVTTGGYSSASGGLLAGDFVNDQKLYLFINDAAGYGGALANRRPLNTYLGEVWMKQAPCNITFDPVTRTLAWDNYLILPANSGQGRIKLAPGSYTFSNATFNVAYLDLLAVLTTGDTPATAVKGGVYFESPSPDRFRGLPHQLPMFYWNGAGDYGSLCGFPRATEPGSVAVSSLAQDDVVVKVGLNTLSAFVKGAKFGSKKYLEQTIGYENRPFDPTGVDAYGNSDLWRLKHTYEADWSDGTSFTRGRVLNNGGEIVGAWKVKNAPDYIGGFHGDEIKSHAVLLLDGVPIPFNTVATYVGKKLQFVQYSTLYKCNTQVEAGVHSQSVTISHEGGLRMDLVQNVKWSAVLELEASMMTMLPIKRLVADTSGEVITNAGMRAPYASVEDMAVDGFPHVITFGSLPDMQLWGPTGISASVEMVKHPGLPSCGSYFANAPFYNKIYCSVAGSAVSAMGGTTHITKLGEAWDVESVIRMTTSL